MPVGIGCGIPQGGFVKKNPQGFTLVENVKIGNKNEVYLTASLLL